MSRHRRLRPVLQPLIGTPPVPLRHTRFVVPGAVAENVCIRKLGTTGPGRGPGGPTNFDTLKVVQRLEAQGFTPEQSQAVMELLKDVIDESVMGLTHTMVTREEQDKVHNPKIVEGVDWRYHINRKLTSHNYEVNYKPSTKTISHPLKTNTTD